MKAFWKSFAHIAIIAAGTAAATMFPQFAGIIIPVMGAANALSPSPVPTKAEKVGQEVLAANTVNLVK